MAQVRQPVARHEAQAQAQARREVRHRHEARGKQKSHLARGARWLL